jgi:hypothetical protein
VTGTDLTELRESLDIETGRLLHDTPDQLDVLLTEGLRPFNAQITRPFSLVSALTIDRPMDEREERAYVLWCAVMFIDQESLKWSMNAVKHKNAAGSSDLTGVEFALAKRRKEIFEQQLGPLLKQLGSTAVVSEVKAQELGETLQFAPPDIWSRPLDQLS